KNLPLEMTDESYKASYDLRKKLENIFETLQNNPALFTPQVLESLISLAGSSPYRDINDPGADLHHRQTPGQDVCLKAVRTIMELAVAFPRQCGEPIQA